MAIRIIEFATGFQTDETPGSTVAASTISVTPTGDLSATTVQAALVELQGDIDAAESAHSSLASTVSGHTSTLATHTADISTLQSDVLSLDGRMDTAEADITALEAAVPLKADASALTAHESDTSTHGVATVAGLTETQTFENKIYNGGTASATSQLRLPKAGTAVLTALGRQQGAIYFDTDLGKAVIDDGSNLSQVGSGSGSGINVIDSPDDATSWGNSGSTVTATTTTTTAELPLAGVIASAIKVTGAAGYARIRWTMPEALKRWKIPVSWYQLVESGYASGDFKVDVYTNSASDYSGSYTRKTLSSDSSSVTSIPANNGFFGQGAAVSFDAGTEDYYEMRITRVSGTKYLCLANVKVGPGELGVTPASSGWQSYTPTFSAGFGSVSTINFWWRQDGPDMLIQGSFLTGTTAGSIATFTLPNNYTVGSTAVAVRSSFGEWYQQTGAPAAVYGTGGVVIATALGANTIGFDYQTAASTSIFTPRNGSTAFNSSTIVSLKARIPIAEWAGVVSTGPVPVEEFAYNSDVSSTTSVTNIGFAYSPAGVQFASAWSGLGSDFVRRVRFQYPIQSDDTFVVEISRPGFAAGTWYPIDAVYPSVAQGSNLYGCTVAAVSGSSTDVDIVFQRGGLSPTNGTYAGNGAAWSNLNPNFYWRVRKTKKASLPYQNAGTDGSSGLYQPGNAAGIAVPASTTVTSYPAAGAIGETKEVVVSAATNFPATTQFGDLGSLSLTPGVWSITFQLINLASGATVTAIQGGISTTSGNSTTGLATGSNYLQCLPASSTTGSSLTISNYRVNVTSTTTYYGKVSANYSAGTPQYCGRLTAIRIA